MSIKPQTRLQKLARCLLLADYIIDHGEYEACEQAMDALGIYLRDSKYGLAQLIWKEDKGALDGISKDLETAKNLIKHTEYNGLDDYNIGERCAEDNTPNNSNSPYRRLFDRA